VSCHADEGHWAQAQKADPETSYLYTKLEEGANKPTGEEMMGKSWVTRCMWAMWEHLKLENDVLFFHHGGGFANRIVVPPSQVQVALSNLHHDLGHAGMNKMETAARKRFWWPNMKRDIMDFCRTCSHCGSFKSPTPTNKAPLKNITPGFPNELIGVDLMGPMQETNQGNKYILVIVDFFTKWCEAIPLRHTDSATIATSIVDIWICRYGAPLQLHSDRGTNFESALMQEVCRCLGIDKTRTTAYHPEGNGQVERTNRSLKSLLKALTTDVHNWDVTLPRCVLAYNAAVHSSTGQTPSQLWTGREIRLPSDLRLVPNSHQLPINDYVIKLRDSIRKCENMAREHLGVAQKRQKEYYDRKAHGSPLKAGDNVWLHMSIPTSGMPAKLHREWKGPYTVMKVLSDTTCLIKDTRDAMTRPMTVHFNRLKPYDRGTPASPSEMERPEHTQRIDVTSELPTVPRNESRDFDQVPEVGAEVEIPLNGGIGRPPGSEPN
ncbi:MAG: DDE-type integrase/transposase/recombinase, partial [Weissella cibaria]